MMTTRAFVVFVYLSLLCAPHAKEVSVGVIGAGIGGGSLSYYLKKHLGVNVTITAFESRDYIGGRLKHVIYDGAVIELGGDAFADENTYLVDIVKDLKISLSNNEAGNSAKNASAGIWDGKRFVQLDSLWMKMRELAMEAQILRFKTSLKLNYWLRSALDKTFSTFEDFLWYGDMTSFSSQRSVDLADYWLIGSDLARSAWEPLTRVIYDQSLTVQAFAGIVALLPMVSDNFSASKGNSAMVEEMFRSSDSAVYLNTKVNVVKATSDGRFQVEFSNEKGNQQQIFDHVVLAAPFEYSNLKFEGFQVEKVTPRKYRGWDITVVIAKGLNPNYFHTSPDQTPDTVLTTATSSDDFISITYQGQTSRDFSVYKVSSNKNVSTDINSLFVDVDHVIYHTWDYTFPSLDPLQVGERYQPITLFETGAGNTFYYLNGLESVATAMECSVISARNVAQLISNKLKR